MTNQRSKAVEMLQEIIKKTPEKYQPYELLAQLLDDEARALQRANQLDAAKAEFAKAAAQYEQSLLIQPDPRADVSSPRGVVGGRAEATRARHHDAHGSTAAVRACAGVHLPPRDRATRSKAAPAGRDHVRGSTPGSRRKFGRDAHGALLLRLRRGGDQAGFYDKAAELLRRSIALDPANAAEAYNYLGYMFADHNMRLDEAEEAVKHALALDPNNGAFLDSMGWVNFRKGRYEEALRDLLRAAQSLTKSDPVVYDHIGDTYAKLNNVPQALEYWQKAIALDPANKVIADKVESTKTKMSKSAPVKPLPIP
jgi:tetratricopeptide (TPR) repeat protein